MEKISCFPRLAILPPIPPEMILPSNSGSRSLFDSSCKCHCVVFVTLSGFMLLSIAPQTLHVVARWRIFLIFEEEDFTLCLCPIVLAHQSFVRHKGCSYISDTVMMAAVATGMPSCLWDPGLISAVWGDNPGAELLDSFCGSRTQGLQSLRRFANTAIFP